MCLAQFSHLILNHSAHALLGFFYYYCSSLPLQVLFYYALHHTAQSLSVAYKLNVSITLNSNLLVVAVSSNLGRLLGFNASNAQWELDSLDQTSIFEAAITCVIADAVAPSAIGLDSQFSAVFSTSPELSASIGTGRVASTSVTSGDVVVAAPTPGILLVSTSSDTTVGNNVAVGEEISVVANITLPESYSRLSVTLTTDPGQLLILESSILWIGANLDCVAQGVFNSSTPGQAALFDSVVYDFGPCLNSFDNVQNADDMIQIALKAVVLNVTSNVQGTGLAIVAIFNASQGSFDSLSSTQQQLSFQVAEPAMEVLITDPEPYYFPGEVVPLSFTIDHSLASTTAAHNVSVMVQLPRYLTFDRMYPTYSGTMIQSSNGTQTIHMFFEPVPTNAFIAVTIYAALSAKAPELSTVDVNVSLSYASVESGVAGTYFGRVRSVNSSFPTFRVAFLHFTQQLIASSIPETLLGNVTVGEQLTIQLNWTVRGTAELQTQLANAKAAVHAQTNYYLSEEAVTVTWIGANVDYSNMSVSPFSLGAADDLGIDFGVVSNNATDALSDADRIVVELMYRVRNIAQVTQGLTSAVQSNCSFSAFISESQSTPLVIVLPYAAFAAAFVTNTTLVKASSGTVLNFQFSVVTDNLVTNSEAFLVNVSFNINFMNFSSLRVVSTSVALAQAPSLFNNGSTDFAVFQLAALAPGSTWFCNVTLAVSDSVPVNYQFPELMALVYNSSPDLVHPGRPFKQSVVPGTVSTRDLTYSFALEQTQRVTGRFDAASGPFSNIPLSIGEVVDFRVNVTLPPGTASSVLVAFQFTAAVFRVVNVGVLAANGIIGNGAASQDANSASMSFATLVFPASSSESGVLEVQALLQVTNVNSNANGVGWQVKAAVTYATQSKAIALNPYSGVLVEPKLTQTLTSNVASGEAGDTVLLNHTISHAALSTADAFNVFTIYNFSYFDTQSVAYFLDGKPIAAAPMLTVLPLGSTLVVVYNTTLDISTPIGSQLSPNCVVHWASVDLPTDARTYQSASPIVSAFTVPLPVLSIAVARTPNAPLNDLQINQVATLTMTMQCPRGTATGLKVVGLLPAFAGNAAGVAFLSVNITLGSQLSAAPTVTFSRIAFSSSRRSLYLDSASHFDNKFVVDIPSLINAPAAHANVRSGQLNVTMEFLLRDDAAVVQGLACLLVR